MNQEENENKRVVASMKFGQEDEPIIEEPIIAVYRASQEKVEKVELDAYLFGVLAGEMPASFEMEALKAQAVASRTYIARIISRNKIQSLPDGAGVTDTAQHQV